MTLSDAMTRRKMMNFVGTDVDVTQILSALMAIPMCKMKDTRKIATQICKK